MLSLITKKSFKDEYTRRLWHKVDFGWAQEHEIKCYQKITKNLQPEENLNELWYQAYLNRILCTEKYIPPEELPFISPEDLQYKAIEDSRQFQNVVAHR